MSKLQELIQRLCPNGVEYKSLGEVACYANERVSTKDLSCYVGVETLLQDRTGVGDYRKLPKTKDSIRFKIGDILVGNIRPYLKKIWLADKAGGTNGDVLTIRVLDRRISPKYLYYLLANDRFSNFHDRYAKGAKMPRGDKNRVLDFLIPVLPVEVQAEIVRILDRFTDYVDDYVSDLQAELRTRKQQYEYYSNLLFAFGSYACQAEVNYEQPSSVIVRGGRSYEVKWEKLGDIGTFIRGSGLQKKDFIDSGVGCIHYGQIYTYYSTFTSETKSFVSREMSEKLLKVNPGNLIIACTSENVEDVGKAVAWLGKSEIVIGGHSAVFRHTLNPKYVAYFFQTQMFSLQKKKIAYGAKIIDLKTEDLAKMIIPVPPSELQERIVAILERFEALVGELTKSLPREIELRKIQSDYYRNKLFCL